MSDTIVKSLDVRWNGKLVGSYDKFSSGSEQFTYDPTYLADSQSGPISLSLPLKAEVKTVLRWSSSRGIPAEPDCDLSWYCGN